MLALFCILLLDWQCITCVSSVALALSQCWYLYVQLTIIDNSTAAYIPVKSNVLQYNSSTSIYCLYYTHSSSNVLRSVRTIRAPVLYCWKRVVVPTGHRCAGLCADFIFFVCVFVGNSVGVLSPYKRNSSSLKQKDENDVLT